MSTREALSASRRNLHGAATAREARRFEAFRDYLRRSGLAPVTRACYASDWATLASAARGGRFDIAKFRADSFDRARRRMLASGTAPATLNRRLSFLRRYSAFAARSEPWLEPVAAGFAELPFLENAADAAAGALGAADERRIRAAADVLGPQASALVALILGTGLRAEDVARIRAGDVDVRGGRAEWLRVRGRRPKVLRIGPFAAPRIAAVFRDLPRAGRGPLFRVGGGKAMTARGIEAAVRRAADAAGVSADAESLRRTFVVRYLAEHPDDDRGLAHALGVRSIDEVHAYRAMSLADPSGPRPVEWRHLTPDAAGGDPESYGLAGRAVRVVRDEIPPGAEVRIDAQRDEEVVIVENGPVRVCAGDRTWAAPLGGAFVVPRGEQCTVSPDGRRAAVITRIRPTARRR